MAFKECDEQVATGLFWSLASDGDSATVIFMGEPVSRDERYQGKPRTRFYFPIVTSDGLSAWGVGVKLYKQLRDNWKDFNEQCFRITRHGTVGDVATKYSFKPQKATKGVQTVAKTTTAEEVHTLLESVSGFTPSDSEEIPI